MLIFSIFFPYVLLICFFIRSLFLPGAMASLRRLVTTETRGDNYTKLASCVAIINLVTSLLSTSISFLVLGFWATTSGSSCVEKSVSNLLNLIAKGVLSQAARPPTDIVHRPPLEFLDWINQLPEHVQHEVVHFSLPCSILVKEEKFMEGAGLAYVAFSQVVSLFPGSSFWAIIFFLALATTSLSTMVTLLEGIMLPLQKKILILSKYPKLVPVVICLGGFLGSLIFTSRPGSYVVFLIDDHLVPMVLVIIVVFQNLSLAWVYGVRRFRAEIFGQLGRLVWAPFSFLWSYVTLPTLLALFTIYFLNIYHSESLYYISWNDSMSQEVKQPYQKIVLGWVTFLSVLALLPIPMYPLQRWWNLDDDVICDVSKEPASSRKVVPGSNKATQRPMYLLRRSQEKDKASFQNKSPPETSFLQHQNVVAKTGSENYSTFSFPYGSTSLISA